VNGSPVILAIIDSEPIKSTRTLFGPPGAVIHVSSASDLSHGNESMVARVTLANKDVRRAFTLDMVELLLPEDHTVCPAPRVTLTGRDERFVLAWRDP